MRDGEIVQVYGRRQLLALRTAPGSKSTSYVGRLAALGLLRYRGCRASASTQRRRSRVSVYQHDPHNQLSRVPIVYRRLDYRRDDVEPRDRVLVSVNCVADERRVAVQPVCRRVDSHPDVHEIPTIIGHRPLPADDNTDDPQLQHGDRDRRAVARHTVRRTTLPPPFNVGIFNARSVHNKSRSIADWIVSRQLSVAGVVETWHDAHDSPALIACCPPTFSYVETARPRSDEHSTSLRTNHGSVCLFFRDSLKVSCILFDCFRSFEVTFACIMGPQFSATFAVVYHPGSSAITDLFFSEFSDLSVRHQCSSSVTSTFTSTLLTTPWR